VISPLSFFPLTFLAVLLHDDSHAFSRFATGLTCFIRCPLRRPDGAAVLIVPWAIHKLGLYLSNPTHRRRTSIGHPELVAAQVRSQIDRDRRPSPPSCHSSWCTVSMSWIVSWLARNARYAGCVIYPAPLLGQAISRLTKDRYPLKVTRSPPSPFTSPGLLPFP